MTEQPDYQKALAEYGAEAVDLTQIGDKGLGRDRDMPLRELQRIAFEEMEKIDRRCDTENVVRIGDYYWIHDQAGDLHLAADTVPVAVVKIHGLETVKRFYEEAKRQEHQ